MVNLDDVLPQATIMVVSVTASTTSGQPLSSEVLQTVLDAASIALQLDEDKSLILQLVQQKMHKIAPNLSTAVGTEVAARLMGVAGGLINLSKMPACNVQVRSEPASYAFLTPGHAYSCMTLQPWSCCTYASTYTSTVWTCSTLDVCVLTDHMRRSHCSAACRLSREDSAAVSVALTCDVHEP